MSEHSPTTGAATPKAGAAKAVKGSAKGEKGAGASDGRAGRLAIELQAPRTRALSWAIVGTAVGLLLVFGLGVVFQWIGAALIALGLWNLWWVVRTLRHAPGTLIVDIDHVVLPKALCHPDALRVERAKVSAVYFLRRAVPWHRAAPLLVIEVGADAFTYPRDWFANEAEQRHILHALVRTTEGAAKPVNPTSGPPSPATPSA